MKKQRIWKQNFLVNLVNYIDLIDEKNYNMTRKLIGGMQHDVSGKRNYRVKGSRCGGYQEGSIRYMIKETDGDRFEEMRSLEQDLTFQAVEKEFSIREIPFGSKQMQTLKLLNSDGIYTNLALREALLNVLVHRDYGFSASALISIYADRMEFVSVGGLLPGIELEDVLVGLSVCRNQNLANVFYRLELIEAYGTGIRKIMKAYENTDKTPTIETTNNAFKITLPNTNYGVEDKKATSASGDEERIIDFARGNGEVTRANVEALFGISASSASRMLRKMVEKGLLEHWGNGRNSRFVLSQNSISV